jgi:transposase
MTSKIHALVDSNGLPVRLALTAGEAHDNRLAGKLLSRLKSRTMLLAARSYDADWIRALVRQRGAWANIPPKINRTDALCFSPYLYRARNLVERFFNKIEHCRPVATRYDKLAANYLAFVQLASIRLWLRINESTSLARQPKESSHAEVQVAQNICPRRCPGIGSYSHDDRRHGSWRRWRPRQWLRRRCWTPEGPYRSGLKQRWCALVPIVLVSSMITLRRSRSVAALPRRPYHTTIHRSQSAGATGGRLSILRQRRTAHSTVRALSRVPKNTLQRCDE